MGAEVGQDQFMSVFGCGGFSIPAQQPGFGKGAFDDTFQALDSMDKYREEALPRMRETLNNLEKTISHAKSYMDERQKNAQDFRKELATNKPVSGETDESGVVKVI